MSIQKKLIYSVDVKETLKKLSSNHSIKYSKHIELIRETIFLKFINKPKYTDFQFSCLGWSDLLPIYNFLNDSILNNLSKETLMIVAKISYMRKWKSYIPSDREMEIVSKENLNLSSLHIYISIIANMANKHKYVYNFTQAYIPIVAILQSLYNVISITEFNEQQKKLPF